jgi:serum/glucocorticoid-regulated kinase 2
MRSPRCPEILCLFTYTAFAVILEPESSSKVPSMSWLGKSKKSISNLRAGSSSPSTRPTTPTPRNPDGKLESRSGLLMIRVINAEGLSPPAGTPIPPAVQSALSSKLAKEAAFVSPTSVTQQRLAKGRVSRDSIQRAQYWWLPYLVMEFEVNQVLITPLGGDIEKPLYMYQAHL